MDKNIFCYFYPLIFCLVCLEYSSPHTVIMYHVLITFATSTSVQKETRIARMQRICSFTDLHSIASDSMRLSGAGISTDFS